MKLSFSMFVAIFVLFSFLIGAETKTADTKAPEKTFTKEELAKFDGTGGKPAYVAVDGVVYDVTGVEAWKNGTHKGNKAGVDITEMIKKAPHGLKVLGKLKPVGKLK